MSTDNENLLDSNLEGETSGNDAKASSNQQEEGNQRREDTKPYRPRIQRPVSSYSPTYGRAQNPYNNRYSDDRPSYNNDRPSYNNDRPSYNNDRPSYNSDRPSYNNDRPSYNNDENHPHRPRISPVSSENAYRPRYNGNTYNNRGGNNSNYYGNKPSYQNDGDSEGQQRPSYRPQGGYNNGGYQGGQRRSYNNGGYNNGGGYNSGSNYNNGGDYGQRRPRFNQNQNSGYGRPNNNMNRRPRNNNDSYQNPVGKRQIEYKEVNDPNESIRLNKYLANAGICSRREADTFIQAGVVSVNGQIVSELGTKVKRSDDVKFHDDRVSLERKIYIILNKPKDCVTTSDDPQARKTVMDFIKGACRERVYPVGRLDRNTTGVLLLTNDGELASKLTHPKFLKKKVYQVTLDKVCQQGDLDHIASGVELEDGEIKADAVGYSSEIDKKQVGIEIHSGKNRIVRRIFESLGYRVLKLDRVLFAGLTKKGLRRGDWRFLTETEVGTLRMGAFE